MSSTRNLRKSVLCMAMGLCLSSLAAGPVFAQSVAGAVAGRAEAGAQVTVTNVATGLTRSATVDANGRAIFLRSGFATFTAKSAFTTRPSPMPRPSPS